MVNEIVSNNAMIMRMKALYNNFESNSLLDEIVTEEELDEENEFVELLLQTPVMR